MMGNINSYTDTSVTAGTRYYYSIRAVDVSTNFSDYGSEVTIIPVADKLKIIKAIALPSIISNNKAFQVRFQVDLIKTPWANIDRVALDLSPVGLNSSITMTDISGVGISFEYNTLIPPQEKAGKIDFSVKARDVNGVIAAAVISISNVNTSPPDIIDDIEIWPNYINLSKGDEKSTRIIVRIKNDGTKISIRIYNLLGYLVKEMKEEVFDSGIAEWQWDLFTDKNEEIPAGTYIVSIKANNNKPALKKIIIIR